MKNNKNHAEEKSKSFLDAVRISEIKNLSRILSKDRKGKTPYIFSPEPGLTFTGLSESDALKHFLRYILRKMEKENTEIGLNEFIRLYVEKIDATP